MHRASASIVIASLLVVAVACGKTQSPLSPSASPGSAVINGSVTGASSGRFSVAVAGTSVTADVDNTSHFVLHDVPSGQVSLRFSGPGVSASLGLDNVQPAQDVTLVVAIAGSTAAVETDSRVRGSEAELEGRIDSIDAGGSSLIVSGRTVTTSASTQFLQNGSPSTFAGLSVGLRVKIRGSASGSGLSATTIEWKAGASAAGPTAPVAPGVELSGSVSGLSGAAAGFQFTLNGRLVKGDATTRFTEGAFSDLRNGVTVEVKGTDQTTSVLAMSIHIEDNPAAGDASPEAEVRGKVTSITLPTLVVNGRSVTTTSLTVVRKKGAITSLSALVVGDTVEVEGALSGAVFTAKSITIEDSSASPGDDDANDAADADVELQGSAGAVTGTCPAVSFSLGGVTVTTSASTDFRVACSQIAAGKRLEVKGVKQPNGTIQARRVDRND